MLCSPRLVLLALAPVLVLALALALACTLAACDSAPVDEPDPPECETVRDCQAVGECQDVSCTAKKCVVTPSREGLLLPEQPERCVDRVCDGAGSTTEIPAPSTRICESGCPCDGAGTCPNFCDITCDALPCGDATDPSSCIGCAVQTPCAIELGSCQADQECIDFVTCIDPCTDQACFDACVTMYPNGATLYNDLVFCVICENCPTSCDGPSQGCP